MTEKNEKPDMNDPTDVHGDADRQHDYAVGYGRPPRETRFKPGRSGNPAGRTKGSSSLKSIMHKTMFEKVTVRTPKGPKKISKLEALVQRTFNDALSGNYKAQQQVMTMLKSAGLEGELAETVQAASAKRLAEEDQAILDRLLGRTEKPE